MKPRIAVITMYYKTTNYGGALQAYALVKSLERLGYSASQISYDRRNLNKNQNFIYAQLRTAYHLVNSLQKIMINFPIQKKLNLKYCKFSKFRDCIPHTDIVNDQDITIINDSFDIFITGSDQVWHPNNFETAYSLSFVENEKKRIAYAASIAHPSIPLEKQEVYRKELQKFHSISVRENLSVSIIQELGFQVIRTLDPTLLLSKSDWEAIAPKALYDFKYIFCYFFENNSQQSKLVEKISKIMNLPIVVLSHLNNRNHKRDKWDVDYQIIDASPPDLLALIRDARYVFTDSYHVSVFSCLFGKDFFVFPRGEMTSRIETLLDDFSCQERFIDEEQYDSFTVDTQRKLPSEDSIKQLREKSLGFLRASIED